jgi:quercetin dioxygenase-like cupin family protein
MASQPARRTAGPRRRWGHSVELIPPARGPGHPAVGQQAGAGDPRGRRLNEQLAVIPGRQSGGARTASTISGAHSGWPRRRDSRHPGRPYPSVVRPRDPAAVVIVTSKFLELVRTPARRWPTLTEFTTWERPMPGFAVRSSSMRRTETPNAVMTTLASPTQGPTDQLSLWRVEMQAGQQGPRHVFDSEQVWHVLAGELDVTLGDQTARLRAGDAVVLPAKAERQISAVTAIELIACGHGSAVVSAPDEDAPRGTPPWIS